MDGNAGSLCASLAILRVACAVTSAHTAKPPVDLKQRNEKKVHMDETGCMAAYGSRDSPESVRDQMTRERKLGTAKARD